MNVIVQNLIILTSISSEIYIFIKLILSYRITYSLHLLINIYVHENCMATEKEATAQRTPYPVRRHINSNLCNAFSKIVLVGLFQDIDLENQLYISAQNRHGTIPRTVLPGDKTRLYEEKTAAESQIKTNN